MESAITVLNREELLLEHTPHSLQFQTLTEYLLLTLSSAAVVPPLAALEIPFYSMLALFHDIGKRAIPLAILNKPGSLTAEEFEVVKTHTIQGCRILEERPELRQCGALPLLCDVCRHHHERWDGSGYPDRLTGICIAPWVQVVGLADAFDALIHPRAYKGAYAMDQARRMIVSGACGAFDPQMLVAFNSEISGIARAVYGESI